MSSDSELQRHQADWENFITLTKSTIIGIIGVVALMAIFLTERTANISTPPL